MLGSQREGAIRHAGRDQRQLVSHRPCGSNSEFSILEDLPFAALDLAAAGKNNRTLESRSSSRASGFAIVCQAGIERAQESILRGWVQYSRGHGSAIFDHGH